MSVIDKKVMIRRFDFWLPLRNFDKEKKQELIRRKMNNSWTDNKTPSKQLKYTETHLNDKIFDDPKVCEELLKQSQNVYIRKLPKESHKGSPFSEFPDLSIVQDTTHDNQSPLKATGSDLDDTVDKDFRKLALNAQNLDGSTVQDLSNFVIMMSDPRKSRPLKSDRQHA